MTKARLDGNEYDLVVAVEQFAVGDTRVIREEKGYYLVDPSLDSCPSNALTDIGAPIVQCVNAVCRVVDAGFKSVALSGVFEDCASQSRPRRQRPGYGHRLRPWSPLATAPLSHPAQPEQSGLQGLPRQNRILQAL